MTNSTTLKEITKDHFNKTAKNYNDSFDGRYVKHMYNDIITRVLNANPSSLLDLGCGNGNILKLLSDKTNIKLYGLDLCEEMINEAKKTLNKDVTLTIGDAEHLPYSDNAFDCIICNASFHHYIHPDIVLKEIKRVLKPNGIFILGDPTAPFNLYLKILNYFLKYGSSGDYHMYSKKEITKFLTQNNFNVQNFKMLNYRSFILTAHNN